MKRTNWVFLPFALAAMMMAPSNLRAAELGMDAPALHIAKFVKGGPVDLAKGKGSQIYVVEFWATWCGPCRVSIPHLTELQKKFKDKHVTMVGISDETIDKVAPFVKDMGDKMDYVVAIDDEQKTAQDYMAAFDQNGIPTAFVVDKAGKVVWFGHPMGDLEKVLDQVVEGKFDVAAYKAEQAKRQKMIEQLSAYLDQTTGDDYSESAKKDGAQFVENCADQNMLNQFAWIILTHAQVKHRDMELAMTAVKKANKLSNGKDPSVLDTYARALHDTGEKAKAIDMEQKAVEVATDPDMKQQLEATLKQYRSEQ